MRTGSLSRALALVAVAASLLASCASPDAAAKAEAARLAAEAAALAARQPPPIALSDSIAQSAATYLAFTRDVQTIQGGFADAESIQAALRRGSAYDPAQLSRGMIAYASIIALQSPEFLAGVRQYGGDPLVRQKVISDIMADNEYVTLLPGSQAAATLIMANMKVEIDALSASANSIENDAYAIQARSDPRRAWATAHVADRASRLESAKTLSGQTMLPSAEESARLFAAANNGSSLALVSGETRRPPYPPAVNRALSLAALAALGAAGDNAKASTDALQEEPANQFCLSMSKLNLYQCLAASRPSYEDIFCVGRHVMRDLATCTRASAMPAPIIQVSDPVTVRTPQLSIPTAPLVQTPAPSVATPAPVQPQPQTPRPTVSATERLNTTP
jgi:hypothetical protein